MERIGLAPPRHHHMDVLRQLVSVRGRSEDSKEVVPAVSVVVLDRLLCVSDIHLDLLNQGRRVIRTSIALVFVE